MLSQKIIRPGFKTKPSVATGQAISRIRMENAIYSANALEQIKQKEYHLKYQDQGKDIYLIGIHFDSAKRNISSFEWEKV